MAIEPKGGRKRVLKRIAKKDKENQDVATENSVVNESEDKKSSVIPSPIFQAAPTTVAPARNKVSKSEEKSEESSEDDRGNRKRRRRGGRGRRHGRDVNEESSENTENSGEETSEEESSSEEVVTHRRRRRRRAKGSGEVVEDRKSTRLNSSH